MKPKFCLKLNFFNSVFVFALMLVFLCSCSIFSRSIPRKKIASEILCPDGKKYLIRYAYAKDVINAIRSDYARKVREKSSESYTAMKIPGMESFLIEQNPSEKLLNCQVSQGLLRNLYPKYVRKFGNAPSSQF